MIKNLSRALMGASRHGATQRVHHPRLAAALLLAASVSAHAASATAAPTPATPASTPATTPAASAAPLKVGFVYVSPIGSAGWTYQHDQGRLIMERNLGAAVKTTVVENVAEGADSERVMRDLAATGHKLIFATSFGYLDPALKVAAEFPDVKFEHMGGYKTAPNLNIYNARFYEGRYLAGYLAGRMSKTGSAGYVAGFPIPEVIQGINAYTLGMRAANPQAVVKVVWLNTWFDPAREREAAQSLLNQGVDTLTYHSGSTAIPQLAEEKKVMLLGYQSDMRDIAPTAQLSSVTHHWGERYTAVAKSVIDGTWKVQPFWGGVRDHVIHIAPLPRSVPTDVAMQLKDRERAIAAQRLHPFAGKLVDQAGTVRQKGGTMRDADIAQMNWFVTGVQGQLPKP
jgi:simple sugar transport system substrate-binding protein